MKAFGELVTTHGLDTAKGIVSRALGATYGNRINPWELSQDAVKWLGHQPNGSNAAQQGMASGVKIGRPAYTRQPDAGWDFRAYEVPAETEGAAK